MDGQHGQQIGPGSGQPTDLVVNKLDLAVNKTDLAVNKSDLAVNKSDLSVNTVQMMAGEGGRAILLYTWLC